ncbi:MAG: arsenate reductase family protein [Thermomicrobiales bacterium]|nr:arsenate reductase family protein [Thermomicrobiales bacterium]MCO5223715.1 arsenate reductase family protein [Thermomicrobiales bacterium]
MQSEVYHAALARRVQLGERTRSRKGSELITAYLYRSCSSCRNAENLLKSEGADFKVREFFKQRFTVAELEDLLKATGLAVSDILSVRSTPYKEMGLATRNLSDEEILQLMTEEPRLLRRPLLVSGSDAVIGYNQSAIRELIARDNAS